MRLSKIYLFSLALFVYFQASHAEIKHQEVISIDGREILLNKDGTWKYHSTDRFANTKDGLRIRLKDDGTWQVIGNAPVITEDKVATNDINLSLSRVVIETYEKKVQKNTRIKTQTVFYIDLEVSPATNNILTIDENDIARIEVSDNNGKNYPVLSIEPLNSQIKPGAKTTIIVRAEKSPSIFNDARSMSIIFHTGILGIKNPINLKQNLVDFDKKKVPKFE